MLASLLLRHYSIVPPRGFYGNVALATRRRSNRRLERERVFVPTVNDDGPLEAVRWCYWFVST